MPVPPVSLRMRFAALLAALVFAIAGLLGGIIGHYSVSQLREHIGFSLLTDAGRIADRLNKDIAERAREIALLAALDPMRNLKDPAAVQALLDSLRRSSNAYLWLGVTDVQGRVVTATDGSLVGSDVPSQGDIRDQLRGFPTRQDDPLRIVRPGDAERPAPSDVRPMNISRPIRAADGTVVGVIVAQLSWDWVRDIAKAYLTPQEDGQPNRQTVVVSATEQVLAGPADLLGRTLNLSSVSRAKAGLPGWSTEAWSDGQTYIVATGVASTEATASGPGAAPMRWIVLVRELANRAFEPASQLTAAILVIGLLLSLAIAALGWVFAGLITRPLRTIILAADQLRSGENVELPMLRGAPEVEMLSASLRALVASLTFKQVKLDEMESQIQRDVLTGLMNRTGLQAWLLRATAEARTAQTGLLVLVGDLDGFKQVNDTMGHAAGDRLLCEVAARLQTGVRAHDAVARMGGDEFILILHAPLGLADRAAMETANRVWARVTEPYLLDGRTVTIGLSLGGAGWPEDDRQLDLVLNKADAALYAAKRAGKGRIVFHREPALR